MVNSKPYAVDGNEKTVNSKYILFSLLTLYIICDPADITSHLIFVKSCPTVNLCFYGQN